MLVSQECILITMGFVKEGLQAILPEAVAISALVKNRFFELKEPSAKNWAKHSVPSGKLAEHSHGKSLFFLVNIIKTVGFSMAMLVYQECNSLP